MRPLWCFLVLEAFVSILAQRPLNTTTNLTNVLTEPFFVKPTSFSTKQMYGKTRDGSSFNTHESIGIRNKERMIPPPHPNSHMDIFNPPLNVGGGHDDPHPPPHQAPPSQNRLHTVNRKNFNKFAQIKQMSMASANSSRVLDYNIGTIKKNIKSEPFMSGPDNQQRGVDADGQRSNPLTVIKNTIRNQDNQHTPSPPPNNVDDIDFDEKLGVKCSFEKPCAWTFEQNVTGPNFEIVTGVMLKEANVTGERSFFFGRRKFEEK